jgi:membrane-anchored protein YejM (alkaline phosphatase superfamily)
MHRLILIAILIAIVTVFETTQYYTHILRFYSWELSAWDRTLLVWSLVAKTLTLILPALIAGYFLQRVGRNRLAWVASLLAPVGILAWLTLDVKIQTMTGQHVSYYVARLFNRNAQKMMGSGQLVLTLFAPVIVGAIGLSVLTLIYHKTKRFWHKNEGDQTADAIRTQRWTLAFIVLTTLSILVLLALRLRADQPAALERLYASLPTTAILFHPDSVSDHGVSTFGYNVDPVFSPLGQRILEISRSGATCDFHYARPSITSTNESALPNVVLLILESFRHESISPQRMPRLHAWAQKGIVATNHYSSSNCSPQGGFALLFGQLAMCMDSVLDTGADASLCSMTKTAGYETSLHASCDFFYRRMSEYFGEPDFDSVELLPFERGRWPQADRQTIRSLQTKIESSQGPQLCVAFLLSTHYDYQYPAELENLDVSEIVDATMVKGPGIEQVSQRESRLRYLKSLAFMDEIIGDLVDSLDMSKNIVIVTGDHGEAMWEDGTIAHGSRLSEIQTRVPMVIRGPGIPTAQFAIPTSHIDLLPTLAANLGVTISQGRTQGVDWLKPAAAIPRLLIHEYPDTWDVALIDDQLADDDEKLMLNVDRKTGATRVLGFIGDEGIVENHRKKKPKLAAKWAASFRQTLDRIEMAAKVTQ